MNIPESAIRPFEPYGIPKLSDVISLDELGNRLEGLMNYWEDSPTEIVRGALVAAATVMGAEQVSCTNHFVANMEPNSKGIVETVFVIRFRWGYSRQAVRINRSA